MLFRSSKPNSPEWETKIVDLVKDRMKLISAVDVELINQLKVSRHLSAHPVIGDNSKLFKPVKESVKANMKNVLKAILVKPAFYSNNIFEVFITDIAKNKKRLDDYKDLKQYLNTKYFGRFHDDIYESIFKSLWKVVFITTDSLSLENRGINNKVLTVFLNTKKELLMNYLKDNTSFFKVNYSENEEEQIKLLVYLMVKHKEVYNVLSDEVKLDLIAFLKENEDYNMISWYRHENFETYKVFLSSFIDKNTLTVSDKHIKCLQFIYNANGVEDELKNLYVDLYLQSKDFDTADSMFDTYINPILNKYSLDELENILKLSVKNSQVRNRNDFPWSSKKIKEILKSEHDYDVPYDQHNGYYLFKKR